LGRGRLAEQKGITRLPHDAALVFRQFVELTEAEQLQAYLTIREYFEAQDQEATPDPALEARAGALDALLKVLAHLDLDDAMALEAKRFDAVPSEVRNGWSSQRVLRAWGTWQHAKEVAAGERPRLTARQRAIKKAAGAMTRRSNDYFAGIRAWLATNPPLLHTRDYDEWCREHNAKAKGVEFHYPLYKAIHVTGGVGWKTALAIANREITLDEVKRPSRKARFAKANGEHDLVTIRDIGKIIGISKPTVIYRTKQSDFPTAVLVKGGRRYWLRPDIKAYHAGKPFPARSINELDAVYVDADEAAEILGFTRAHIALSAGHPEPVFNAGNRLWRRTDIEEFRLWRLKRPRRHGPDSSVK
jgi:predicted DNA-binding transcriptional regulator AlpA